MSIIQFKDVWEIYRIKFVIDGKNSWENFWALKGLSFEVEQGETLGIIGENGAGKSTILKLIAGMLKPDRGEAKVLGKVSGLLELGAGFQSELTGRENIYLNVNLFGISQDQIEKKYEEITSFADIGKFINAPVKCYSQGMFVRLAFAIAIHMDPDILLIDDTLAVGDEYFQKKCIKKIFEIKEKGKTIILVTHDINMLNRLCKRAILLKEGRMVKDDFVDKVTPLYTQIIGSKEGVAVLEKKPLNIVFNNGSLFLNWENKLITPNSGLYTVFTMANKWYSSFQAEWKVERKGENALVARGEFHQVPINQIWQLELNDNYEIKLDIEIDSKEPFEVLEGYTNIMLTGEYSRWFTTLESGKFPPVDEKNKNWQPLLEGNVSRNLIGVAGKEKPDTEIPSLVLRQSNHTFVGYAQIFNADYLSNCKVLQYKTICLNNFLASQSNRINYFTGKIILGIPDIINYLDNLEENSILYNGPLRLVFDNGKCILWYNNINLTKISHMSSSIYANGRWYLSTSANWLVKKNKNKIIAYGIWYDLAITQIWEIELTSDSTFSWKIDMDVDREVDILEQRAQILCSEVYKYYFSDYGQGSFPDKFVEVEDDMLQRCIPDGVVGIYAQDKQFPGLNINFPRGLDKFAKIFNADFYNKGRILRIEKVESEESVRLLPGHYPCFEINFSLDKDKKLQTERLENKLEIEKLKFIFDNGRGRIYWDGTELTKKLGFYTSLRFEGRRHNSVSSAIWKVEEINKARIKALGKWLYLPITQNWDIRLKDNNAIEFQIVMNVFKEIKIDRLQMNLMLLEKYSQWIADKERGCFPLFKGDITDDWQQVYSVDRNEYIGVSERLTNKGLLPSVTFSPQKLNSDWLLNIVNSDIYHRSRVLQYLNSKMISLVPGEYSYACGTIIIS